MNDRSNKDQDTKKKSLNQNKFEDSGEDNGNLRSIRLTELSPTDKLIEKYGINPAKTPVLLKFNAYRRMVGYAMRYANNELSSKNWREVYGILIGSIENNKEVIIKDAIPMIVGDRAGVAYENKQYVDMAQIDESVYQKSVQDKKNDFIIGWWHTHPGFKFFFSSVDCLTQLGYQIPNPFAVGLIFNHCELKSTDYYLGVAALRMLNPEQEMLSTYDFTDLEYEFPQKEMIKEATPIIKDLDKNITKVLKEIKYIDQILRKRYLAQLQRNYGLILVPKSDIIVTADEEEAEEDERYLYEWDPDFFKKSFRIPKFREKVEEDIKKYEKFLLEIKKSNDDAKFKGKREKFKKKIQTLLAKPNDWYNKLIEDFTKRIEIIFPYYDYLDTNERKIIEHFESRSSDYYKILDYLNSRSEFNL
ncbi:MAG: Mov34/MPN/PAD-1 family protein [Promethearchaeota archaeon]